MRFESTLYEQLKAAKPSFLSTTDFIQCMAAQGLSGVDSGITLIKPSAPEGPRPRAECFISNKEVIEEKEIKTRKKSPKDPFSSKTLDPDLVPEAFCECAKEIIEFWAVKKGTRSEGAATRLFNKLGTLTPEQRITALHAATDAGWSTIYEPKASSPTQSRHNHQAEPEFKHPAHQVFTAADFT